MVYLPLKLTIQVSENKLNEIKNRFNMSTTDIIEAASFYTSDIIENGSENPIISFDEFLIMDVEEGPEARYTHGMDDE